MYPHDGEGDENACTKPSAYHDDNRISLEIIVLKICAYTTALYYNSFHFDELYAFMFNYS